MDRKKIIVIVAIICVLIAASLLILSSMPNYERIEITPNGTSIDVLANKTEYVGDFDNIRFWKWNDGALITYNSHKDINSILNITGSGFNAINDLVKKGERQEIDGVTCYVVNADELLEIHVLEIIKVNYNGKLYCIPLANETTHDNIIICCKDKDIALHMAKSVEYKKVYPDINTSGDLQSTIENLTGDLKSKTDEYLNDTSLDDARSTIENITSGLPNANEAKSQVENITGDLLSRI